MADNKLIIGTDWSYYNDNNTGGAIYKQRMYHPPPEPRFEDWARLLSGTLTVTTNQTKTPMLSKKDKFGVMNTNGALAATFETREEANAKASELAHQNKAQICVVKLVGLVAPEYKTTTTEVE